MTCAVEISHFDKDQLGLIQTQSINQNYIYTCIYRYIYIYMQLSHYGTLTARHPWHLKQGEEQSVSTSFFITFFASYSVQGT